LSTGSDWNPIPKADSSSASAEGSQAGEHILGVDFGNGQRPFAVVPADA